MAEDAWPQSPRIRFYEDVHRYTWDDVTTLDSVTGVVGCDLDQSTREAYERTRSVWEPRGNKTHAAFEEFWKTGQVVDMGEYAEFIEPLISKFDHWADYECLASEYRLCLYPERIAGSCDAVLRHIPSGKLQLVDVKTSSPGAPSAEKKNGWKAQLGGYDFAIKRHYAHPEVVFDRYVILQATPGKTVIHSFTEQEVRDWWDYKKWRWTKQREDRF